jgi:FkbM family methyltransferase
MNASLILHKAVYRFLTIKTRTLRIGGDASWNIKMLGINEKSFVISAGAGHDISFELNLVSQTGCRLILLDPSPTGRKTVGNSQLQPEMSFEPSALSDKSGYIILARPTNILEGSWRVALDDDGDTMPCTSISDILKRYSKSSVDLLKIDIEGFEYEVLYDVIQKKIPITQICVEIHQGQKFGKTRWDRWHLIYQLHKSGYRLIHCVGWDHTFLHKSALTP